MAMRRLGVPKEVALCMFRTLQQMRHGDSELSFSSFLHDPFQGVGQGNVEGPTIRAAVSAPLFAYMGSKGLICWIVQSMHSATPLETPSRRHRMAIREGLDKKKLCLLSLCIHRMWIHFFVPRDFRPDINRLFSYRIVHKRCFDWM